MSRFTEKLKIIFTKNLFSWRTALFLLLGIVAYLALVGTVFVTGPLLLWESKIPLDQIPLLILVVIILHSWFTFKFALSKIKNSKKLMFLIQLIFLIIILPGLLNSWTSYSLAKEYDIDVLKRNHRLFQYYTVENNLLGGGDVNLVRLGAFIGSGKPRNFKLTHESNFLKNPLFKLPLIGYQLRILDKNTSIDFGPETLLVREIFDGKKNLRIFKYDKNKRDFTLVQEQVLPKDFSNLPLKFNRNDNRFDYAGIFEEPKDNYFIAKLEFSDFHLVVPYAEIKKNIENLKTNEEKLLINGWSDLKLIHIDEFNSKAFFDVGGKFISYNYDNGEVELLDENYLDSNEFIYFTLVNSYFKELIASTDYEIIESEVDVFEENGTYTKLARIISRDEGVIRTRLIWFVDDACQNKFSKKEDLDPNDEMRGCILLDQEFEGEIRGEIVDVLYSEKGSKLFLADNFENDLGFCGTNFINYILHASSTLEAGHKLPSKFVRSGFNYEIVDFRFGNERSDRITYRHTSCANDGLAYLTTYQINNSELVPYSYSPDPDICKDEICGVPAIEMDLVTKEGRIATDDPNVISNESRTAFEVLFPEEQYDYVITGIRDDVYQIVSNAFTIINMPIKIGMKHKYEVDFEAKNSGEDNWLTIRIDENGDGKYEKSVEASDIFTGKEFVEQCGRVCEYLEKQIY